MKKIIIHAKVCNIVCHLAVESGVLVEIKDYKYTKMHITACIGKAIVQVVPFSL